MITKLTCSYCGRRFSVAGSPQTVNTARRAFNQEHAGCRMQAYHAALALVDWLEPEPGLDRAWKVGGVWYEGLYAVLGALQNVRG